MIQHIMDRETHIYLVHTLRLQRVPVGSESPGCTRKCRQRCGNLANFAQKAGNAKNLFLAKEINVIAFNVPQRVCNWWERAVLP